VRTGPLLVGAVLALTVAVVLVLAMLVAGTPQAGLMRLAVVLSLSGAGSLLLGAALVRLVSGRVGSLQLRIALTNGIGLLMGLVNVLAASMLMFLNSADLPLFALMLAFAAVISITFGYSVAAALMRELNKLGHTAARLAGGDLGARVGAVGSGEVARLGRTFDYMADRVQAAFARERELEASRRQLLAAVSHDLRTPLATTRAMVEAIAEGVVADPNEVRHYLQVIRGEVQHLSRLIDDMFRFSQIESGTLELQRVPTDLSELVSETLAVYDAQGRDRGVALEQRIEPGIPPVAADPVQLQGVLRHLIDNALRYTPSGGFARVEAQVDGSEARVSVVNSGAGLGSEEMERAFDPFYRGEPARSRAPGTPEGSAGTGLSLALARALVQAHDGRIWAESSSGGVAMFHFTIPFVATDPAG